MLRAFQVTCFLSVIVILVGCLLSANLLQRHEITNNRVWATEQSKLVGEDSLKILEPYFNELFAEPYTKIVRGNEADQQTVTNQKLINTINHNLERFENKSVATIFITNHNGKRLFEYQSDTKNRPVFHLNKHDYKEAQTQAVNVDDSHMIIESHHPIYLDAQSSPAGVLHVVTNYNHMQQQSMQRMGKMTCWIYLIGLLMCIALILVIFRTADLYKKFNRLNEKKLNSLKQDMLTDELTKLPNKRAFIQMLEENSIKHHDYKNHSSTIFLVGLDSLKSINETHGYQIGDGIISRASQRIRSAVPFEADVARVYGDVFGIILPQNTDLQEISNIAKNILKQCQIPYYIENRSIFCSSSIGIVINQDVSSQPLDIINDAEISMNRAKIDTGSYEIFSPNMHRQTLERFEKERDIHRGIGAKEMINRYQPIVDLSTGMTHSFEALARWQHPEEGELPPSEFIDIAEETGLVGEIDKNALSLALQDLSSWKKDIPALADLKVNVNHSARHFNERPTIENILSQLAKYQLSPNELKIELTESSIIENEALASTIFESLREKGIHFCMDDFGTGFSSINYLRKLNFDMLKIDRSFVLDMEHDEDARKIIQTIIDMGKTLNISVTAEGVETKQQADMLKDMGCTYAQGYFYAHPMLKTDVIPFLQNQINTLNA